MLMKRFATQDRSLLQFAGSLPKNQRIQDRFRKPGWLYAVSKKNKNADPIP